jgi:hypothetical protein
MLTAAKTGLFERALSMFELCFAISREMFARRLVVSVRLSSEFAAEIGGAGRITNLHNADYLPKIDFSDRYGESEKAFKYRAPLISCRVS